VKKATIQWLLIVLVVGAQLAGCSAAAPPTTPHPATTATVVTTSPVASAMPAVPAASTAPTAAAATKALTSVKYATGFKIEYLADGVKKVTDGEKQQILLVAAGKRAPAGMESLPQVTIPIKRAVYLSSTSVSLLRPLKVLDTVIGVTTEKDRWYIDEMKRGLDSGRITLVGKGMGEPDYEKILALKPDVVFMYTGSADYVKWFEKFKELKIPVAVDNEYLENDPLGRMEWIKFLAAFYDKDAEADAFFRGTENRVQAITAKVSGVDRKPNVAWLLTSKGTNYVPGGDSYVAKMIAMAGGDYWFKDHGGVGDNNITEEEVLTRGQQADVLIWPSFPPYVNSMPDVVAAAPKLADLKVVKDGKAWCFQPWFYQSLDKTEDAIQDLAAIFHPDLFLGYELKQFRVLPREPKAQQ